MFMRFREPWQAGGRPPPHGAGTVDLLRGLALYTQTAYIIPVDLTGCNLITDFSDGGVVHDAD
jgi:hypothetical protein